MVYKNKKWQLILSLAGNRGMIEKFQGKMAIDKKFADEIIDMEIWD